MKGWLAQCYFHSCINDKMAFIDLKKIKNWKLFEIFEKKNKIFK